ncbi:MAG: hypothetical protein FWG56_05860 [Desulfovibrionaceae bacterium]|nr:hypothetical protein [Desulfovibrionaceae bacterium]
MRHLVYQIYYDEKSRNSLDSGFVPLNNTENRRPDWYELWVIKNFLENTELLDDAWYGFLSPKFYAKTRLRANDVHEFLKKVDLSADAVTISYSWEQIAYFLNSFEQGDLFHPGITKVSQQFFDLIGLETDLAKLVGHSGNSVFCNFIIAKPVYWKKWLEMVVAFFDFVEKGGSALARELGGTTSYGSVRHQTPMKTFVQERFPSVILTKNRFRTEVLDISHVQPVFGRLFQEHPRTRRLLQTCDALKREYSESGDADLLNAYWKVRSLIPKKF